LVSGGGYGELNLMVSNNSGLYEGSTISAVAVAIVPLILWFTKYGTVFKPDWKVKIFCYALVFACLLIPVGTAARTGLLCIVLVALLMLRDSKRRLTYLAVIGAMGLIAVPLLPPAFVERMQTIQNHEGDSSASTRVAVWKWTIDYARTHPFGGGFEAYRQNRIRFDTVKVAGDGSNATVQRTAEYDQARAYHSAYFEMLGEQGYFGLALWLVINLTGVWRMEVLRHRYRKPQPGEEWAAPLASALQAAHLVYLLGAAFVGIAFQPFVYMLIGAQIGLDTYLGRLRNEGRWQPFKRPNPGTAPLAGPAHV
jgi:probable O-glycosylation ligase (exosortase A-associated)